VLFAAALSSCGPRALTPAGAQAGIQAVYTHQDQGYAAKSIPDLFYHIPPDTPLVDITGSTIKAFKEEQTLNGLFYHGSNLQSTTKITSLTLTGNQATVVTSQRMTYNLTNSNYNSVQGIAEPFQEDFQCRDVWTYDADSGWWMQSSHELSEGMLRNGVAFSPPQ
jgi:hypothetical protein